jgi:hypothetical protein
MISNSLIKPYLRVVLADAAILVPRNDILGQETPPRNGGLGLCAGDAQAGLIGLVVEVFAVVDIEDCDCTEETHALFRHCQKSASIGRELHTLHGCGEIPHLHTFT